MNGRFEQSGPDQWPDVVQRIVKRSVAAGFVELPPTPVTTRQLQGTLFVTAGIQNWRDWVLAADGGPGARIGHQWCVRTNRLTAVGESSFLTSFCMVSMVRRGVVSRTAVYEHLLTVLSEAGLPTEKLAFVVPQESAEGPGDPRTLRALAALGIRSSRVAQRPRRDADPFRGVGPFGPNTFVLAEVGDPCSAFCSPVCTCGRYLHFFNCEFLDHERDVSGRTQPARIPVVDCAGSVERLACAISGVTDIYEVTPLRTTVAAIDALRGDRWAARDWTQVVADHCRTAALVLGSGIEPHGRSHGHVVRRLLARACATLDLAGMDVRLLPELFMVTAAAHGGWLDFPMIPDHARDVVQHEVSRYHDRVARGRRAYDRLRATAVSPDSAAALVSRIRSAHGVPLDLLLAWLRADGIPVALSRVAELSVHEQNVSRAGQPLGSPRP